MKITLDIKPLTDNQIWLGRRWKTTKGKKFEELMLWLLPKRKTIEGWVEIRYKFFLKKYYTRHDLTNFFKMLNDCLVKKRLIKDDSFIKKITAEKFQGDRDRTEIEIIKIKQLKL